MSAEMSELKAALRRRLRAESGKFSDAERVAASTQIRVSLKQQAIWQQARSILLYVPMVEEPDIWPLLNDALTEGKIVTLPRYSAPRGHYEAGQVSDTTKDLEAGQFGVLEPKSTCPPYELEQLDLTLVPGIGFNWDGYRLGRGKGYYDRLLALVPGVKCGVAFDWQMMVELPVEPHDIRLDCILTPTHWHKVVRQARF